MPNNCRELYEILAFLASVVVVSYVRVRNVGVISVSEAENTTREFFRVTHTPITINVCKLRTARKLSLLLENEYRFLD